MKKERAVPRILLCAPASGSGKTLITCGILQALVNREKRWHLSNADLITSILCFMEES